jgi:hypothetical protein
MAVWVRAEGLLQQLQVLLQVSPHVFALSQLCASAVCSNEAFLLHMHNIIRLLTYM